MIHKEMFNDKNLFRTLAIILLGSIFLPILFLNLPFPFNSIHFWSLIWTIALIFFHGEVLISKPIILVYSYALLFLILFNTIWLNIEEISKGQIMTEVIALFTSISMFTYFVKSKDFKGLAIVAMCSLFFIFFTSFTSLIVLLKFPMAARDITGRLAETGQLDTIKNYTRMGLGIYGFFACLVFIFPVIISQLKIVKYNKLNIILLVIVILVLFYALVMANYFANILISIIVIIFALMGKKELNKSIFVSIFILIVALILPPSFYINLLNNIAIFFDNSFLYNKVQDLNLFLIGANSGNTEMGLRASRAPLLMSSFLKDPIWGGGVHEAHLHWLNKLSLFGLVGTIPFFLIVFNQIKISMRLFSKDYKFYYFLSMVAYFVLGSVKYLGQREPIFMVFLIVPAMYYLVLVKRDSKDLVHIKFEKKQNQYPRYKMRENKPLKN